MTEARDYLTLSPNVSFADDGQTGNRSIRIAIRGVSNVSLGDRAVPNALGYYIDEFNVGTVANGTINPALLDLQRVEVLRGPQGTYFGRNSLRISTTDLRSLVEKISGTDRYFVPGTKRLAAFSN